MSVLAFQKPWLLDGEISYKEFVLITLRLVTRG
jgi:hypothetical protein